MPSRHKELGYSYDRPSLKYRCFWSPIVSGGKVRVKLCGPTRQGGRGWKLHSTRGGAGTAAGKALFRSGIEWRVFPAGLRSCKIALAKVDLHARHYNQVPFLLADDEWKDLIFAVTRL